MHARMFGRPSALVLLVCASATILAACSGTSASSSASSGSTPATAANSAAASAASAAGSSVAAEGCTPAHPDLDTLQAGVISIGVAESPPLTSQKGPNGYSGLDADIIDGFAQAECLTVEPFPGSASVQVQGVQGGRWDTALGGWYRSNERQKSVNMGYPMYLDSLMIVSKDPVKTFDDLKGKNVGVVSGYAWEEDLKNLYGSSLKTYPDVQLESQDLAAGRIDAAVDVFSGTMAFPPEMARSVPAPDERVKASLLAAQTSLPFNKNAPKLLAAFDDYMQKIHADGTLKNLLVKWGLSADLADVGDPRFI